MFSTEAQGQSFGRHHVFLRCLSVMYNDEVSPFTAELVAVASLWHSGAQSMWSG